MAEVHAGQEHDVNPSASADDYKVYIVNLSDWPVYRFKIGPSGKWQRLSEPIGNTCDDDCEECQKGESYALLTIVECNTNDFDLYLTATKDGKYASWGPIPISPKCGTPGESFCIRDPE